MVRQLRAGAMRRSRRTGKGRHLAHRTPSRVNSNHRAEPALRRGSPGSAQARREKVLRVVSAEHYIRLGTREPISAPRGAPLFRDTFAICKAVPLYGTRAGLADATCASL